MKKLREKKKRGRIWLRCINHLYCVSVEQQRSTAIQALRPCGRGRDCKMQSFAYNQGPVSEESLAVICAAWTASESPGATQV